MKRLLAFVIACLMVFTLAAGALPVQAAEEDLPFELTAPANVTAKWMEGNDSPTTMAIAYSLSNEMTAFFKQRDDASADGKLEEFMKPYGFSEIIITTQVDWALDDVNDSVSGWHYSKYWDHVENMGLGYDEDGRIRVGEWDGVDLWIGNCTETVNEHWIMRWVSEDAFNGDPAEGRPGIKDQLRPEQYTYNEEDGVKIDFEKHTAYFRMRFVVSTYADTEEGTVEKYYYSDWSNVASVGKDAETFEALKEGDIAAPVITDLYMTDKEFNGNPIVAYTLTVPEDLMEKATKLAAFGGGIVIETEARVKGDAEWTGMGNADWLIKAGEMECPLLHLINEKHPSIPKDTPIEIRCRYRISQPEQDDFWSDYSEILIFETTDIGGETQTAAENTEDTDSVPVDPEKQPKECPICHFCPQPLGICIFIWLLILAVVVVVVIIVMKGKKKDRKN
ncbi:MAG: hypothetical protein II882_02760 [Lachnospiraceae bacterium]|nr:hypothetical protein [Lachnospiraceae bacterium]